MLLDKKQKEVNPLGQTALKLVLESIREFIKRDDELIQAFKSKDAVKVDNAKGKKVDAKNEILYFLREYQRIDFID